MDTLQLGRLCHGAAAEYDVRGGKGHRMILDDDHLHAVVERITPDDRGGRALRADRGRVRNRDRRAQQSRRCSHAHHRTEGVPRRAAGAEQKHHVWSGRGIVSVVMLIYNARKRKYEPATTRIEMSRAATGVPARLVHVLRATDSSYGTRTTC